MATTDIAGVGQALPAFNRPLRCKTGVACRTAFAVRPFTSFAVRLIFFIYLQRADGAAEHVAGVGEGEQHVVEEAEAAVVTIGYEMVHGAVDILLVVERLYLVFLTFLLMGILAVDLLVEGTHILLLDERGVGEHECTQVTRGRRTIDIALEAHLDDIRNQSGMVDMGMREDDTVELSRIEAEVSVGGIGLHTFTLVHSAVEENSVSGIGGDKVLAARYFTRGT